MVSTFDFGWESEETSLGSLFTPELFGYNRTHVGSIVHVTNDSHACSGKQ